MIVAARLSQPPLETAIWGTERQVEGLVQRSICGHLTEEMTELYSSVRQDEVRAAMEKVVSLAGYRGILGQAARGCKAAEIGQGCESARFQRGQRSEVSASLRRRKWERDIGFEPTTFSLGS